MDALLMASTLFVMMTLSLSMSVATPLSTTTTTTASVTSDKFDTNTNNTDNDFNITNNTNSINSIGSNNVTDNIDISDTNTNTPTPVNDPPLSSPNLTHCQYEFKKMVRNELFDVHGENLPLHALRFYVADTETRCFVTRNDMESKIEPSESEVIDVFAFACLNRQGTDIVFMEDEEAGALDPTYVPDSRRDEMTLNQSSPYRWYDHVISYFQVSNCRINVKGPEMVANMSDLRVLSVFAHRGWNLTEVVAEPQLCQTFRNVVALSILADWTTQSYLHHLGECAEYLHNVVEMVFTNDSLTVFPEVLYTAVPNLRALEISNNNLTAPVDFPWPSGFATLPRNLSRTYQFNVHYNFGNSFDMQPNLFRRVFMLDGNNIRNLTHYQFYSDFQYISLQRNGLEEISEDVFDTVPSVQFLSLADNNLAALPENIFARLVNLKRLDLQGNRLVMLPTTLFWMTRKLERLNVERNQLQVIQEGVFNRLQELTQLKLKNNSIVEVKREAFTTHSVKLKLLELQNNPIKTFPIIVLLLRGLVNTNLQHTDIEVLDFVQLSSQASLSLLSEAVKNPTTGEFVDLKDNPAYQKVISLKHSKLRSVVVYNASRETLPVFMLIIKHFTFEVEGSRIACDCHILNVTHTLNKWKEDATLSGEEACLKGWACIWPTELAGKKIASLKDEDTYCPLEEYPELNVAGSGNTSCPEGCKCYVRTKVNTVIVDCKNAGMTSLPDHVPARTRELWLQNNTIQTLEKHDYLTELTSLKLTANNVQELPMSILEEMPNLTILHIDDNWLTGVHHRFSRLHQLKDLRLAGNPFRCDCHTLWMKQWLLKHQIITKDWTAIKCTTEDDDGQVFTSVPDDQFVCKVSASLAQLAVPIAIPVFFAFLFLILAVFAFIQRRRLKVLIYIHTGYHPFDRDPADDRALYDVTVCCDVKVRAWVLRHVIETLEEGGRYKVFFYSRDAFVGFTTLENVRHCVKNSRRMVTVLGKDWEKDDLIVTAIRESLVKCMKDMPQFLTVVIHSISAKDIDNKDLELYIRQGRYISTDDKHFTKRLLYEMPHAKEVKNAKQDEKVPLQGYDNVALHDIVAIAENDNVKMRGNTDVVEMNNSLIRQDSAIEVDVDLRNSDLNLHNDFIMDRQNSQQPSIGHQSFKNNEDDNDVDPNNEHENANNRLRPPPGGFQNQLSVDSQLSEQFRTIFVWYAKEDLEFTLKNVVQPLEKRGHNCILEDRDFPLGAAIQENIVHAAETSTRCIFVLSNHTARNDWFNFAFHVAFDRHLQSRDHRVALVSREEVDVTRFVDEVQQVLKTSSVLCESDPWFWKRLKMFVRLDQTELP